MDKINLRDINLSEFKKYHSQGTLSTMYHSNGICLKMLDKMYSDEKDVVYRKFLEMDGIDIDGIIFPKELIIDNGKVVGYTMEEFENSVCLLDDFCSNRYVNCKDIFSAAKKASHILRDIHKNDIICQDLTFDNILINANGDIKYCDIDGCSYNGISLPIMSRLMQRFLQDYRKQFAFYSSKNMDRVSFMLSLILLSYHKEVQSLSYKEYHQLSDHIITLDNLMEYANMLVDRSSKIDEVPYMDELINDNDDYIIDREKQIPLKEKILRIF